MIARFGSLLTGAAALAMVLGCYTVSLKVSGERKAVDDLRGKIAGDLRGIRTLQAELRTRSRMPELQRWNDEVLAMSAPVAGQFVRDPVQLASFVAPGSKAAPAAAAPTVHYALAEAPAPAASPLTKVAYNVPATPSVLAPRVSPGLDFNDAMSQAIDAAASEHATLKRVALR